MLATVSDIQTEFLIRNNRTTTDGFISDTTLNNWTRNAVKWASSYKKWPYSEGKSSTTFASLVTSPEGWLRGEYPEGWKADSIRLLTIGDKRVLKTEFYKFQEYLENNPNDSERIFSDFGKSYYINPRIDLSGTVTAWGQMNAAGLDPTDKTATTVFSYNEEDGNEAVVVMMTAYLKDREHLPDEMRAKKEEAQAVLDKVWTDISNEQYGYRETNDEGMWKRIDVLEGFKREDTLKRDQWY